MSSEAAKPLQSTENTASTPATDDDVNGNCASAPVVKVDDTDDGAVAATSDAPVAEKVMITIKVHVGRENVFPLTLATDETVGALKLRIEAESAVPVMLMKVMYKSAQLRDDKLTIGEAKLTNNAKLLVLGCPADQVKQACTKPTAAQIAAIETPPVTATPLCQMTAHKKVLDHGVPDDAGVGIKNSHEALPGAALSGMRNGRNAHVRLTFKLELDQLWVGTAAHTQKVNMGSINDITSEPIEGHDEYHIVGFKMGTSAQSILWVYWVPAQYVTAIKQAILH